MSMRTMLTSNSYHSQYVWFISRLTEIHSSRKIFLILRYKWFEWFWYVQRWLEVWACDSRQPCESSYHMIYIALKNSNHPKSNHPLQMCRIFLKYPTRCWNGCHCNSALIVTNTPKIWWTAITQYFYWFIYWI